MISLEDLREFLGLSGPEHDALLETLEEGAVAFCEQFTGRYFGPPKVVSQILSGAGTDMLWLHNEPAATPAPVVEERLGGIWTALTDPVEADRDTLWLERRWPYGRRNLRVTYTIGYAPGEEPADIRAAVLDLVKYRFHLAQNNSALKSETIGGYSYTTADADAAPSQTGFGSVRNVLEQRRRVVV